MNGWRTQDGFELQGLMRDCLPKHNDILFSAYFAFVLDANGASNVGSNPATHSPARHVHTPQHVHDLA